MPSFLGGRGEGGEMEKGGGGEVGMERGENQTVANTNSQKEQGKVNQDG